MTSTECEELSDRGQFPLVGGPKGGSRALPARVRFSPDPEVPGRISRQSSRSPSGLTMPQSNAQLDFHLVREGQVSDDIPWRGPAKRRRLGFDPGGEEGTLLFEASIEDQLRIIPCPDVVGPRMLQVRLLDKTGTRYWTLTRSR